MVTVRTLSGDEFSPDLPGRLLKIAGDIRAAGGRAFLVGGWVRDAMLGKSCRDYDIEVYDMAQDALVPLLSKYGRTNLVGKAFGVIHLAMKGLSLDFSFPRTENKVGYGHRGFVVHTDEKLSFKEAALRRDFTINAMGMELPELTLCDPYGGVDDLKAHRLKHTLSYNRIKQNEARTYDIINHKQLLNLNINDIDNKDKSPWHLIQEDVNEHENI